MFFVIQIVAVLLLLWQAVGLAKTVLRNRRLYSLVKSASPLRVDTPEGTYVRFEGALTSPMGRTPFGDQPCSWWHSSVKAVFESKAKKPGKGMVTHKPRIHLDTADALPLIVERSGLVAQGLFEDIGRVLINPRHDPIVSKFPPSASIEVQRKYKSYETDEYWLPRDAGMVLCGTVVGRNEQLVTVSGDSDEDRPPMLLEGRVGDLTARFRRHVRAASFMLVLLVAASAAYLVAANHPETGFDRSLLLLIGTPLLILVAVAAVSHWWKL